MYAYVMRPETLPPSYWNFIVKTEPLEKHVLEWVRLNCRGSPVDLAAIESYVVESNGYVQRSVFGVHMCVCVWCSVVQCGAVCGAMCGANIFTVTHTDR